MLGHQASIWPRASTSIVVRHGLLCYTCNWSHGSHHVKFLVVSQSRKLWEVSLVDIVILPMGLQWGSPPISKRFNPERFLSKGNSKTEWSKDRRKCHPETVPLHLGLSPTCRHLRDSASIWTMQVHILTDNLWTESREPSRIVRGGTEVMYTSWFEFW